MDDIKILDDFLPPYIQDYLEKVYYHNISFNLIEKTVLFPTEGEYFDDEQLECWIKYRENLGVGKCHYYFLPLQIGCLNLGINFNFEDLYRAKLNITLNSTPHPSPKINPPHRDGGYDKPFFIGLYYINDSDGDTIIYDGLGKNNLTIAKTVTPKKGRLLIMDGHRFHSSSHPSNFKKRAVINYNVYY